MIAAGAAIIVIAVILAINAANIGLNRNEPNEPIPNIVMVYNSKQINGSLQYFFGQGGVPLPNTGRIA